MKKGLWISVLAVLLSACLSPSSDKPKESIKPLPGDAYAAFIECVDQGSNLENYTASVISQYKMAYSDETFDTFGMDGVIEIDGQQAHLSQHINANGLNSSLEGYYYDNQFYVTYNDINYKEEMNLNQVKESMLAPLEPYRFQEDMIKTITASVDEQGLKQFKIILKDEAATDFFNTRYDIRELSTIDGFVIQNNQIVYTFDDEHYLGEKTDFDIEVKVSQQNVGITYTLDVNCLAFSETKIALDEDLRNKQSAYVAFQDLDTSTIEVMTDDDDSPEDTIEATFRKRIQSRLGYEEIEDNVYQVKYNENQGYIVDFNNRVFIYANYSINYSYSWKGDIGSMGACTYDFTKDVTADECKEETLETIKKVKSYLQMELYYCGLSLEDLAQE